MEYEWEQIFLCNAIIISYLDHFQGEINKNHRMLLIKNKIYS